MFSDFYAPISKSVRIVGCGGGICCPTFDIVDLLSTYGFASLRISRLSTASLLPPPAALGGFVPLPPSLSATEGVNGSNPTTRRKRKKTSKWMSFRFWLRGWDFLPFRKYSRLTSPRRFAYTRLIMLLIFVNRFVKTILNRFYLLPHSLLRRSFGQVRSQLNKRKSRSDWICFSFVWLRGWDLNLTTSGL